MNKDKLMGIKQRFAAGEIKQQHLEMQVLKKSMNLILLKCGCMS